MIGKAWLVTAWLGLFMSPLLAADTVNDSSEPAVTIVEFMDFQCPFCARVQPIKQRLMAAYPGRLRWEIKHFPLEFHGDAMLAHQAALAAGEQGRFMEMHDLLFANRHALKREQLIDYAQRLGLDEARFVADLDSPKIRRRVAADLDEGRRLGVQGTPTFIINGAKLVGAKPYEAFKSQIDSALGLRIPVQVAQENTGEVRKPFIPAVGDAPTQGPDDAPVTIIEFSDFQCPYCRKALPVMQALQGRYPGRIRLAFKHYPLGFHKQAPRLHRAALAAARQGRFWEMHDALFALQSSPGEQELLRLAADIGLNVSRFLVDLQDSSLEERLQGDIAEGRAAHVTGTPTFFINGEKLVGAQPIDAFAARVDRQLDAIEVVHDETLDKVDELEPPMGIGPAGAVVQVIMFADIGSPLSAQALWQLKRLLQQYPGRIHLELRHFPMAYRPRSPLLHRAVLAAAEQGKAWELLDLLFAMGGKTSAVELADVARSLGLDAARFADAMDTEHVARRLRKDRRLGKRLGVLGVPTLFINNERFDGLPSAERLQKIMEHSSADDHVTAGLSQGGKS